MASNVAIKVEHVGKDFVLPHEKVTSIKSAFTGMFDRSRTKESQHALKDINFEVKKGEFFGIVGRNGSGKSTMLKILAGIYQPTRGKVHTYGKLVPFIELGVGFNSELTGRENIYLNGAMLGFSQKEVDAMYDDIVSFAELKQFMDQKLKNYSSGMQVRLAFSMATRSKADILLIDEVLAVGDADFQRKCYEYFKSLKKNKVTVVFVSHDMNAVREFCDRAVLIDKNEIVMSGSSSDVSNAYSRLFVEDFRHTDTGTNNNRWGSKDAVFEDAQIKTAKLTNHDTHLRVVTTIIANEPVEDIVTGILLRNAAGDAVLGTNNNTLQQRIKKLDKGGKLQLDWSIPNIFSTGKYSITLAVESDARIYEWWDEALSFSVINEKNTPYTVSPDISLEIKEK